MIEFQPKVIDQNGEVPPSACKHKGYQWINLPFADVHVVGLTEYLEKIMEPPKDVLQGVPDLIEGRDDINDYPTKMGNIGLTWDDEEEEVIPPPRQQLVNVSKSLGCEVVVTRPYSDFIPNPVLQASCKKTLASRPSHLDLVVEGSYRHMVFSHELPVEIMDKIKNSPGIKHLCVEL